MNTVRGRLRETRWDHCLSQADADRLLNARPGYVNGIERSKRDRNGVSTKTIRRLLEIYPQMDVHWVVTGVCVFNQGLTRLRTETSLSNHG